MLWSPAGSSSKSSQSSSATAASMKTAPVPASNLHRSPSNRSPPLTASFLQIAAWECDSKLMPSRGICRSTGQVADPLPIATDTNGGSSEMGVKELAVTPCGVPVGSSPHSATMLWGTLAKAVRRAAGSVGTTCRFMAEAFLDRPPESLTSFNARSQQRHWLQRGRSAHLRAGPLDGSYIRTVATIDASRMSRQYRLRYG